MIALHLLRHPWRYRLIHINNMPDFLVFATGLPRLLGRPVIHDIHDLMPELYLEKFASGEKHWVVRALKAQERWSGIFASAVITVEERLKDILAERGIPRAKIHVLMNLPDDRIFAQRSPIPIKPFDSLFVLVYHGTLARRLGLDIAIQAAARARDAIPHLELRIIGAGEERERLIQLRGQLGLEKVVTFSEGFVPVEQIPTLIADADLGLIPLRIHSGTDIMLPTKLLEYVTAGIPCVVPRTGTITRYFDENMVRFSRRKTPIRSPRLSSNSIAIRPKGSDSRTKQPSGLERFTAGASTRTCTFGWSKICSRDNRRAGSPACWPSDSIFFHETSAIQPVQRRSRREDRPIPK